MSLVRDTEIEEILHQDGDPIFVAAGLDPKDVQIHLVGDKELNAFSAGGLQLFINTGLILEARTPNELIGVMAHETGHIAGGQIARSGAAGHAALGPLAAVSLFFALLAWLNCHAIDRWEAREQEPSSFLIFPQARLRAQAGLLLAVLLSYGQPRMAVLAAAGAVSALLLALLDRQRSRLTPLALRATADLVLLTPLALLVQVALLLQ